MKRFTFPCLFLVFAVSAYVGEWYADRDTNCQVCLPTLLAAPALAGETTNKIGITMVDIPAGSFLMGSCKVTSAVEEENKKRRFLGKPALSTQCGHSDSDASDDSEAPQHRVSIRAFQMGKTEVTLGQFKRYIAAAGREDLLTDKFMKYNAYGDDAPVVMVSWRDAQAFIDWLNKTDGGGYRLPSEAEWEYACRAGGNHTYCGSDNVDAVAWHAGNSNLHQHEVAGKQPNAWGLYDMSGNVKEWVQDCWHDNYIGAPTDGSAWTSGCSSSYDRRVLRGGSWKSSASDTRAANRGITTPVFRDNYNGFRLARTR